MCSHVLLLHDQMIKWGAMKLREIIGFIYIYVYEGKTGYSKIKLYQVEYKS